MTEEYLQVKNWIDSGLLDGHLLQLRDLVNERYDSKRDFVEFIEGDRVRINALTRPKYLVGEMATVRTVRRTKVVIRLDRDSGRFRATQDITIPMKLLDPAS